MPTSKKRQYLCPTEPDHGLMRPRPDSEMTPEQRWCGEWHDCDWGDGRCPSSLLVESDELKKFLGRADDAPAE